MIYCDLIIFLDLIDNAQSTSVCSCHIPQDCKSEQMGLDVGVEICRDLVMRLSGLKSSITWEWGGDPDHKQLAIKTKVHT